VTDTGLSGALVTYVWGTTERFKALVREANPELGEEAIRPIGAEYRFNWK
jgi:hypothetical protein